MLTALQSRFLYFPSREMVASPGDLGIPYQEVRLRTEDGVAIHGWWLPSEDAPATVLFLHGNAGNVSYWLDAVRGYHAFGWNVLLIDYRGYGLSDGSPSEEGTYLDARAAWKHMTETRGVDPSRIVVIGRSLGGGVALGLLQHHKPAGIVLEATFTSIPDMVAHVLRVSLLGHLMRIHYPNLERIRELDVPVLVVHSPNDDLVPYAHGRALFEAAPHPKRFLDIRGGHNDGFFEAREDYLRAVKEFVEEVVGQRRDSLTAPRE
ncbi:MAG TPA: alpha/beta hydrolase [Candidatus Limnocylindrales bacterium]|nr:alpha/beta hydrolase [Candidatus Limnocylindrales bacterium]